MAETDWTEIPDSLNASSVKRGVTNGIARPNGGGNFVYGFNTQVTTVGAVGIYVNAAVGAGFNPMAKGVSIRGAVQRGVSAGTTNFSPFLFFGAAAGPSVNDNGYLLGLEDNEPHAIVLRKGSLLLGCPSVAVTSPPTSGVLRKSTATYAAGTWVHIRLDVIVNGTGDVLLQCFESALGANAVTAPVWTAIPGMASFVDDALGVNSGSAPYVTGRGGFGMASKDLSRRSYFDHIEVLKQL